VRAELAVRSMPVRLPSGVTTATVVGLDGLPIEEVETFMGHLRTLDSSPNTVTSYARHLALWFRWLTGRGRPMTFASAIQRVKAIGARAGVALTPHTLRHTHGTALAKAWIAVLTCRDLCLLSEAAVTSGFTAYGSFTPYSGWPPPPTARRAG